MAKIKVSNKGYRFPVVVSGPVVVRAELQELVGFCSPLLCSCRDICLLLNSTSHSHVLQLPQGHSQQHDADLFISAFSIFVEKM